MVEPKQMAGPKTPTTARKAPSTSSTPSKSRSSKGSTVGTKRKVKTEVISATPASRKKMKAESGAPAAQMVPEKKQKVLREDMHELDLKGRHGLSTIGDQAHLHMPTPFQTPAASPRPSQSILNGQKQHEFAQTQLNPDGSVQTSMVARTVSPMFIQMLVAMLKSDPTLLPSSPTDPVLSTHIDNIAYKMWQCSLTHKNGATLAQANKYSAMLNEVKLRTLARLNFLPSWWFLREQALVGLRSMNRLIDDSAMIKQYKEAGYTVTTIMNNVNKAREEKEEKEET